MWGRFHRASSYAERKDENATQIITLRLANFNILIYMLNFVPDLNNLPNLCAIFRIQFVKKKLLILFA